MPDGRNLPETLPRRLPLRPEILVAPRADDQIRLPCDHFIDRHGDFWLQMGGVAGEDVDAAAISMSSETHSRDQRIVLTYKYSLRYD